MADASRNADFYLWTRQQAAALRAHAQKSGDNAIDWSGVIEEVEDMGESEHRALLSLLAQILAHAYKIEHSRNRDPIRKWREEIGTFQINAARYVTPALRRKVDAEIEDIQREAARIVRREFLIHGEPVPELPERAPYTIDDLLADDFALRPQPKSPSE